MKKREMLDIVAKLQAVNGTIVKTNFYQTDITNTLADCQNAAILLGTSIENQYMETFKTATDNLVSLLESYCENAYQLTMVFVDKGVYFLKDKSGKKLTKKIQKQLSQIQNLIKYELPDDKKEIVFLPYKASMWDSLESVWKAADEDESSDTYVIPIPYFDKNPDGSFREMHYEGDQYPDYVPITKYDEYDFEVRHPDMIFIHNPYDQYNFVTSVHPFFYSENLKKFTQKLIYIPYFILSENDEAVENTKHFCTVPSVFHADKIIVQSEKMRRIYIDVLTEAMGRITKSVWEKKISGLGSPKFDKVANSKKEDLEIPNDWLRIIEKPDGSWKKVVFYNTSVAALLKYDGQMLKKMETVIRIFKENQSEIALLWRPHPLIMATIESMRPQLRTGYKKLIKQYKEEGWGIYDDSADLDRAIKISDAYYGDASSVVQLYRKMMKPIMIQNIEMDGYVQYKEADGDAGE